jgi:hypothetical protein
LEESTVQWVIPSKIESVNDVGMLNACIDSIRKNFSTNNHKILVVDSNSAFTEHFSELNTKCEIANIQNKNYEIGALYYAVKNYEADYYILFHDSCEVISPFDPFSKPVTACIGTMQSWIALSGEDIEWSKQQILNSYWSPYITDNFTMLIGSSLVIRSNIIKELIDKGLDKIVPTNKNQSMSMERILGMILTIEGYNEYLLSSNLRDLGHVKKTYRARL